MRNMRAIQDEVKGDEGKRSLFPRDYGFCRILQRKFFYEREFRVGAPIGSLPFEDGFVPNL